MDSYGFGFLAAPQGFEPRYAAPEAAVLPLNEGATRAIIRLLPCGPDPAGRRTRAANPLMIRGIVQRVKHYSIPTQDEPEGSGQWSLNIGVHDAQKLCPEAIGRLVEPATPRVSYSEGGEK
jgi:hypothetical protein